MPPLYLYGKELPSLFNMPLTQEPRFTNEPRATGEAIKHTVNAADDVPDGTKTPKSRQPAGLREKILRTPLPYYSGPYSVGMMDMEVPAREQRHFSEIKREHQHLLQLETVLFTIFYPSSIGSGHGRSPEGERKWSRPTWLPRPRAEVAKGYGKFSGVPGWLMVGFFG